MSETRDPNLIPEHALTERDLVLREILRGNPGMTEDRGEDLIDALVDSAAHTLAVEQRAIAKLRGLPTVDGNIPMRDFTEIVNHIDPRVPEAEGGPVSRDDLRANREETSA